VRYAVGDGFFELGEVLGMPNNGVRKVRDVGKRFLADPVLKSRELRGSQ
jgi:hypothetical protein